MKKSILIVAACLLILCLANSMYTVQENQYACVVRLSKIVDTIDNAGLHFKIPFIDSVKYFPKATQLYDIPPSAVITSGCLHGLFTKSIITRPSGCMKPPSARRGSPKKTRCWIYTAVWAPSPWLWPGRRAR